MENGYITRQINVIGKIKERETETQGRRNVRGEKCDSRK